MNSFRSLRAKSDEEFLGGEIDVQERGEFDRSLLHEAIAFGRLRVASALIDRGAPLDAQDEKGQTPLQYAITFAAWDIAIKLLKNGANPNMRDKYGNNALWTASLIPKKNYDIIAMLVSAGGDYSSTNLAGRSVFDFAVQSNNDRIIGIIKERSN